MYTDKRKYSYNIGYRTQLGNAFISSCGCKKSILPPPNKEKGKT